VGDAGLIVQANGPTFESTGLFAEDSRSLRFGVATTTAPSDEATSRVPFVGPNEFALEAWVEVPYADALDRWLLRQTSTQASYGLFVDASGIGFEATTYGGKVEAARTNGGVSPGWHHVVVTKDNRPASLWVDGVEHKAAAAPDVEDVPFVPALVVGGKTPTMNLLTENARLAEVAVYPDPLTALQVAEHFAAGKP
jgi:hypothetical protein